jgi:small subunit ribosomal protein S6
VIAINKYELMLMVNPEAEDERRAEIVDRLKATVEKDGGAIVGIDDWGKKKLAYEIDKQSEAYYSIVTFTASPQTLAEVERVLGITDEVMRVMATRPKA